MRISVAVCTYNGEKYLAQQLESILSQTVLPHEIIICDDNSRDNTKIILEKYEKYTQPKVKIKYNPKNLGSTRNFEQAIKMCSGDIIFLSDQDDVWVDNKVAIVMEAFQSHPHVYMTFSNAFVTDEYLQPLKLSLWDYVGCDYSKFSLESLFQVNRVTGATMAFKKEALEYIFPIPDYFVHDDWLAFIMTALYPVMPLNKKLIYYRQHGSQQIGVNVKRSWIVKLRMQLLGIHVRHHKKRLTKLKAFQEMFQNRLRNISNAEAYMQLDQYINYLEARINLPQKKYDRLIAIKKELPNYLYYENLSTAVKDWLSS